MNRLMITSNLLAAHSVLPHHSSIEWFAITLIAVSAIAMCVTIILRARLMSERDARVREHIAGVMFCAAGLLLAVMLAVQTTTAASATQAVPEVSPSRHVSNTIN